MVWEVKQNRFKFSLILFYLIFSPYLSMFSSPWFLLLPPSSAIFLSPQLGSSGLICAVDSRGVMSHRTPASSLRLQPWMLWPREGHSPRNSSFPVHLTWSRWTGPFPWPNPPAATARPLGMTHIQEDVTLCYVFVLTKTVISHSPTQTLTCVQAVCTPRLRSDRSSLSRKYFPSHHGDTLRLDLPSCCCHPQDAPGDLTKKKKRKTTLIHIHACASTETEVAVCPLTVLNVIHLSGRCSHSNVSTGEAGPLENRASNIALFSQLSACDM